METGQRVEKLIKQGRLVLDRYVAESLEKLDRERKEKKEERVGRKEPQLSVELMEENIRQLENTLKEERRKIEEYRGLKEQQKEEEKVMEELRQRFHYEEAGSEVASILQSIMVYLMHLEKKIEMNTAAVESMTKMMKGKDKVVYEEVTKGEEDKKPQEKIIKDAMKRVTPEKPEGSKKDPEKPDEKKEEPTIKIEESAKELEKPKKKEKVKMKLPFTYSNKKDENLLLWIAEIQTYCSTAPVEPKSQVAFSTCCLGGVAKEWVLTEANSDGFEDIGEWAKTLTLRQFLQKIKERFLDKATVDKAFDELTTIGQKRWTFVDALSREVDRLSQVPRLNLQDNQVLYIYSRALPEPIRGQLVAEAKSGKYNYRQFCDLALQREQMTAQVKGSYASVVKPGPVGGYGKRVLWRQNRHDHMLVLFDDETVEKLPLGETEGGGGKGGSECEKGDVTAVLANKGCQNQWKKKKRPHLFPEHPGIAFGRPWENMNMTREEWQSKMDNRECLKYGTVGHVIALCPLICNPKASG
ncbi:hypothetical protein CBR_g51574 [Chara braunii]|uniref:Retrotransposon gag domain-containing protein n=1 Tax=Chara braunii TaxID=69332 RepID=A0A388M8U7_CHABU|nr:hypothetical protein CBR_g51574 [Chara braunii]|eukprot:GBG90970.1 hypothetical protein CBR_g51574 [Chara braunii]